MKALSPRKEKLRQRILGILKRKTMSGEDIEFLGKKLAGGDDLEDLITEDESVCLL